MEQLFELVVELVGFCLPQFGKPGLVAGEFGVTLEGSVKLGARGILKPSSWKYLVNPLKPSWGEPYTAVESRMLAAIDDAWQAADGGEVVMVSHQMPIVMVARSVKGMRLWHDPRKRRCSLSSITTLRREGDRFVEVDYQEPAGAFLANSVDTGAV